MTNVGGDLTDAVKERTPKRDFLSRKNLVWVQGKYLCNCHGAFRGALLNIRRSQKNDCDLVTIFDSIVIFYFFKIIF